MAIARDIARQQRMAEANRRRELREADAERNRALREEERLARLSRQEEMASAREQEKYLKEFAREEKARHLREREEEVEALNAEIADRIDELDGLLSHTLLVNDALDFDDLRIKDKPPAMAMRRDLQPGQPPLKDAFFIDLVEPSGFRAMIPGARGRHQQAVQVATDLYDAAVKVWQNTERSKTAELRQIKDEHDMALAAYQLKKNQRDSEVDEFKSAYYSGDPDAIISYSTMVLESSVYPPGIPKKFSIAYTQHSRQLVIEMELPTPAIVPVNIDNRYVKSTDSIITKPRKESDIRELYQNTIASMALRTIHEMIEADQAYHIGAICFNGYVHTVDPATGRDIQPHLISVRTTPDAFNEIDLARVDKRICLKNLGAQVSSRPDEAQPVRPLVDFDMADARFVDQTDLVSGLSSATNLMRLTPFEFEQLVANLFGQFGLESKLTRSTRDGGVDCVAYDARPVLGGKVVIQAKRYRHTVGVSAVRDLFGTMLNEGANKGILVTTSGYGPEAFNFAKDKPIELIDGGGLLFLLQEIGVHARILVED